MINLENFFKNHFDSARISDDNFNKFTSDHLERLSNNGSYPTLVLSLTSTCGAWSGATLSEATNEAIKQGYTKAVKLAVDAINVFEILPEEDQQDSGWWYAVEEVEWTMRDTQVFEPILKLRKNRV